MVGEKLILAFDFADDLPDGAELSTVDSASVKVLSGTDDTPASLLNGSPQIIPPAHVLVPVDPTVGGVDYRIKVLADTSTALRRLACVGRLYVEEEPA